MEKGSSSETYPADIENLTTISGLREQIKANAGLLFPHAAKGTAQLSYDIAIMTSSLGGPSKPSYQAVLTFIGGFSDGMRAGTQAARGPSCDTVILALAALLDVTAIALERFQGNVMKEIETPTEMAGGVVNEALVRGKSAVKKGR